MAIRAASPEEQEKLTGVTSELLETLRRLRSEGVALEGLLMTLRTAGVPRPAASIALCKAHILESLEQAREAVNTSPAFAEWPEPYTTVGPSAGGQYVEPVASAA